MSDPIEDDDGDTTTTVYAKRLVGDDDCTCDDGDHDCLCGWRFEVDVSLEKHKPFREFIHMVIAESNKIRRCSGCTQAMIGHKSVTKCTSCFMQEIVDEKLPKDVECPVCLESFPVTQRRLLSCKHSTCNECYDRLPKPKRCPLCRADQSG